MTRAQPRGQPRATFGLRLGSTPAEALAIARVKAIEEEAKRVHEACAPAMAQLEQTLARLRRGEREAARENARMAKAVLRDPKRGRPFCGARCRDGHPCRRKSEPQRERCRLHGGRSTGPKTTAGKARIGAAQRERWARWRAAKQAALASPPAALEAAAPPAGEALERGRGERTGET